MFALASTNNKTHHRNKQENKSIKYTYGQGQYTLAFKSLVSVTSGMKLIKNYIKYK